MPVVNSILNLRRPSLSLSLVTMGIVLSGPQWVWATPAPPQANAAELTQAASGPADQTVLAHTSTQLAPLAGPTMVDQPLSQTGPSAPFDLGPGPTNADPADADPAATNPRPHLCLQGFNVVGSTVFSQDELKQAIDQALAAIPRPSDAPPARADCQYFLSFEDILLARSAITQLYVDNGYVTSGAILPEQRLEAGTPTIQVIEGRLTEINVNGTYHLQPGYISSRLAIAAGPPLNIDRLLEGLRLLQLNPLIDTISADLQDNPEPGTNRLVVTVNEADTFSMHVGLDNNRSPSVGSVRRSIGLTENNLVGLGDAFTLDYYNTDGSNEIDTSYRIPLSPYDTALTLTGQFTTSQVIEAPFDTLGINGNSYEVNLGVDHPLINTPTQNLRLGLNLFHSYGQSRLGIDGIGGFPLVPGADAQGKSAVTSLGFSQTWTQRSTDQVVAALSQFNLGIGALGATVNTDGQPDSNFFSWQGQAQWVRQLAPDMLLIARGSVQLASDSLLLSQQFSLGGQATVRGYRQDQLLTDNGLQGSVEARFPILRIPDLGGVLQIATFLDGGYGWNVRGPNPDQNTLIGLGTGLLWQQSNLSARIDWGIPLISVSDTGNTLQDNGIYFSVAYSFF